MAPLNLPDINPKIQLNREEAFNLLLTSLALEEISLSHLLHAEGEKIQKVLSRQPSVDELLTLNRSLERTLRNTLKSQMLLQFKLEDMLDLIRTAKSLDGPEPPDDTEEIPPDDDDPYAADVEDDETSDHQPQSHPEVNGPELL